MREEVAEIRSSHQPAIPPVLVLRLEVKGDLF
jgi:hypothetical protein